MEEGIDQKDDNNDDKNDEEQSRRRQRRRGRKAATRVTTTAMMKTMMTVKMGEKKQRWGIKMTQMTKMTEGLLIKNQYNEADDKEESGNDGRQRKRT